MHIPNIWTTIVEQGEGAASWRWRGTFRNRNLFQTAVGGICVDGREEPFVKEPYEETYWELALKPVCEREHVEEAPETAAPRRQDG